jgi:hypothetical protein
VEVCAERLRHAAALLQAAPDQVEKETAHAAEQNCPDVLMRRCNWFDAQPDLEPSHLVFIDG